MSANRSHGKPRPLTRLWSWLARWTIPDTAWSWEWDDAHASPVEFVVCPELAADAPRVLNQKLADDSERLRLTSNQRAAILRDMSGPRACPDPPTWVKW